MAVSTGSIASSSVNIRPRFYDDPYAIQNSDDVPGLSDITTSISRRDSILEDDLMRQMIYVIDWKIVKNTCTDLLGMLMSQSFTNERADNLNSFEFTYIVDRTGPAREMTFNNAAPLVTLETFRRRVLLTNPRAVCIAMPKRIYQQMKKALQELIGLRDKERSILPYLGEDGKVQMTPLWRAKIHNYMDAIKARTDVALNSQNQGTNESQLEFLFSRAPDLKLAPIKDIIITHDDIQLIVPYMIRSFVEHTFIINKIMGVHLKKPTLSKAMSVLFKAFKLNTSQNLMPELEPTFENTPFTIATGIITCTNNIKDQLASAGLLQQAPNGVLVKKVSYCRVGEEDLHPFDNKAPHNMVKQVDVGMFRQTESGSLQTFEKRVPMPIDYVATAEGFFVVNVVTEADFGNTNALSKIGMRQIYTYDEMIPVGFVLDYGGQSDFDKSILRHAPQKTFYTDHHGTTRSLNIAKRYK